MKLFTTMTIPRKLLFLTLATLVIMSCKTDIKEITIRSSSRMYAKYSEEHKVKMYEKFTLSDSDLEAVVVEFYPDFAIDTLAHKAITLSDTLKNPAAKILIIENNKKKEEAYAFPPGMMPHYSPRSFIGFELVDYKTGGNYIKPVNTEKQGVK